MFVYFSVFFSCQQSSATQLANAEATSTDMQHFYHWQRDATANQYIDKSISYSEKLGLLLTETATTVSGTAATGSTTMTLGHIATSVDGKKDIIMHISSGANVNIF